MTFRKDVPIEDPYERKGMIDLNKIDDIDKELYKCAQQMGLLRSLISSLLEDVADNYKIPDNREWDILCEYLNGMMEYQNSNQEILDECFMKMKQCVKYIERNQNIRNNR